MGNIVNNEPHDPRSSSKSLAMQWKHENVRIISVIAVVAIAITVVSVLVGFSYSKKTVSVFVDGQLMKLETRQDTVREVLDEHAITVGTHDDVSVELAAEVEDGTKIIIDRAEPVHLTVDGQTKTLYTTEYDVKHVLDEANVSLTELDKVYPSVDTAIKSDMDIKVVRVTKDIVQRKVDVPFQVVKQADPNLKKGSTKTVQKGQNGLVVQQIEQVYEDGKLVLSQMVGKTVQAKQVDQVIAYGTKKEPEVAVLSAKSVDTEQTAKDSVGFDYKKKLTNVQLTAYTEEKGTPGAKTASGTKVTEGRTIAVDPDLIPLGWWVYIEGYGFYRAEDTGGAVKGKIVDIYYDSSKEVKRFGRKKGNTVYVIGPVKPEAN
ncbi:ubiquitin-like domain-containing protein [Paenibacillus marinisediminis]